MILKQTQKSIDIYLYEDIYVKGKNLFRRIAPTQSQRALVNSLQKAYKLPARLIALVDLRCIEMIDLVFVFALRSVLNRIRIANTNSFSSVF